MAKMTAAEAQQRILASFKQEVRRHRGRIGELEEKLGRYRGYLAKVGSGRYPISLSQLLEALQLMDVDPAEFFGRSLDLVVDVDQLLREVAGDVDNDPELEEILRVGDELEKKLRAGVKES